MKKTILCLASAVALTACGGGSDVVDSSPNAGSSPNSSSGSTPAPSTGSSSGSTPPPSTGSSSGSTPPPSTGSSSGSTPPPSTGSSSGSTPPPSTGSSSGSTPPSTSSSSGSTPPSTSSSSGSTPPSTSSSSGSTPPSTSSSSGSTPPSTSSSSGSSSGGSSNTDNSVWAINVGGDAFTDDNNQIFVADTMPNIGKTSSTTDAINNTENDSLYQSERYAPTLTYNLPVTESSYDVTLKFAETFWEDDDKRLLNINIEGESVLTGLDIHSVAGHDNAYDFTLNNVFVNDGQLTITVSSTRDNAKLSAILVTSQTGSQGEPVTLQAPAIKPGALDSRIKVNQIGFMPTSQKIAVVPDVDAESFHVIEANTGNLIYTGDLTQAKSWDATNTSVKIADFSNVRTSGEYQIRVVDIKNDSYPFTINENIYSNIHDAALKAYYYNRASIELEPQHAGKWARAAGHPDTNVEIAPGAEFGNRRVGDTISAPKGWYDAGDYNKYVVNSGISTYTLLSSYEHFEDFYATRNINIPESGDNVPDILNEVMWNLDWLEKMQDVDGGVYHKLTTERFSGRQMPNQANAQRYVVDKNTGSTLNFAAVMAVASRVYANFDDAFPGKAAQYRQAAIDAYEWAKSTPNLRYSHLFSVTGEYGDGNFRDEFSWAAAELFILTENNTYLNDFKEEGLQVGLPSWPNTASLGFISLAFHGENIMSRADYKDVTTGIINYSFNVSSDVVDNPYQVPMETKDFNWGSNSHALNRGFLAYQAYRLTGEQRYLNTITSALDYVLGRNALDYSFVTGFGERSTMFPHHRPSDADSIDEPVPGFIAGGPNAGQQDIKSCEGKYPSTLPALSYADDWCSYASNEVTINWNAPLVYLLAALQSK